jgi:glycosyltransferase involved in cell wall biosynthesis
MKILFITEEYPPLLGGVATSSGRVAEGLAALGCDLQVVTFDCSRSLDSVDYTLAEGQAPLRVARVGPFFTRQRNLSFERIPPSIRAVFRRRAFDQIMLIAEEYRPDIVLSFYAVNAGLIATYVARQMGVPHLASIRGADVGRNIFCDTTIGMLRTIVEGSAHLACVNRHLQDRLKLAFPDTAMKSSVIMNSVALPPEMGASVEVEKQHDWSADDLIAIFLGTPREKKGIHVILRALKSLEGQACVRLLIVGPAIQELDPFHRKLAEELTVAGRLYSTGELPRTEALEVAGTGDVILMPSLEDGMANGLLEGMALGLCPVVSDLFSDILDAHSGYVVKRGDAEALAGALADCARGREERRAKGERAKQAIANRHSPQREAKEYLAALERCVREK